MGCFKGLWQSPPPSNMEMDVVLPAGLAPTGRGGMEGSMLESPCYTYATHTPYIHCICHAHTMHTAHARHARAKHRTNATHTRPTWMLRRPRWAPRP